MSRLKLWTNISTEGVRTITQYSLRFLKTLNVSVCQLRRNREMANLVKTECPNLTTLKIPTFYITEDIKIEI
jgi:hypothetical protein